MKRNIEEKREETEKLHKWFREIWDEREDEYGYCYCFETKKPMYWKQYRHLSTVYDHVLDKRKSQFPEYKFTKRNVVIILPEVHFQKTKTISKTPRIEAYKNELLSLHEKGELKD
jgi:hypothetical protein